MITAWASSPDGAITVLAAPGGVPVEVRLSADALRRPPDALAGAVLVTATAAGRLATAQLRRELATLAGEQAGRILDELGLTAPDDPDGPRRSAGPNKPAGPGRSTAPGRSAGSSRSAGPNKPAGSGGPTGSGTPGHAGDDDEDGFGRVLWSAR